MPHPLLPDLEDLASATAVDHGFELADLQVLAHMQPMTVQIQIRRSNGDDVTLDDCAGFSAPMGEALENSAFLSEAYVLEISSPGIGEQLQSDRDFQTFRRYPVDVIHRDTEGIQQRHSGTLLERTEDLIRISIHGRIKQISRDSVISVELTSPTG
ncbi:MAG: ribosome maturation factor RimP [Synechococcus sp.]|uniref:ribosome maturation factor RimP n=1 Tax=Synechococcus sp. PROS-9-1 TaxID=1968775 RepID=UPI000DFEB484|nr:ribosome maturation factor RimP [Synechococcus sp. PROS-9-1]QNJ32648.1 ribosome maturation factor RimP [Synechococcus sp. PROS-9-1]RCL59381.1 MAG: ribosome assembly cofactor RimP [Synechococcus sp. MED-G68]